MDRLEGCSYECRHPCLVDRAGIDPMLAVSSVRFVSAEMLSSLDAAARPLVPPTFHHVGEVDSPIGSLAS